MVKNLPDILMFILTDSSFILSLSDSIGKLKAVTILILFQLHIFIFPSNITNVISSYLHID